MVKMWVSNKGVLVRPDGKLLLMILPDGDWDFPGGRMEEGEQIPSALAREVREECGIAIDPAKARPFFADVFPYAGPPQQPCVIVFHIVPVRDDSVTLSDEHVDYKWVDPRQPLGDITDKDGSLARILDAYRKSEGIVVAADPSIKGRQGFGLVQVFTGNGKGKTTSALGEAIRALGAGKKVGLVYFDKGGTTHYSERTILDALFVSPPSQGGVGGGSIRYVATGRDRIDPVTGRFDFSIQQIDRDEAKRGLDETRKMFAEGYDLVVLDEINSTADLGMIALDDVLALIDAKPAATELVLTGRNAADAILDRAYLVTEMKLRKHYFYSGVKAREGLDY